MPIPDYQSLMLPVLHHSANGEVRVRDVIERVADQIGLTDDERAELLPSGKQTVFANRTHWAKTYLNQAGLVESTRRGYFQITQRGRELLGGNPEKITNATLSEYPEFIRFIRKPANGEIVIEKYEAISDSDKTPDEVIRDAHQQFEMSLRKDLLRRVQEASPSFFEGLIVNLLVAMGYGGSVTAAGRALGKSGDGGVDGVIDQDALGLDRVYVQAKRNAEGNNVGSSAVRNFFGSLDRFKASKGLLVTTADFTVDARQTAEALSKRIVLVDGSMLTKLMVRHNVGCRVEETLYLRRIDEDFFSAD